MVAYITYWVTIVEEPKSYFIIKLIGNRFAKQRTKVGYKNVRQCFIM